MVVSSLSEFFGEFGFAQIGGAISGNFGGTLLTLSSCACASDAKEEFDKTQTQRGRMALQAARVWEVHIEESCCCTQDNLTMSVSRCSWEFLTHLAPRVEGPAQTRRRRAKDCPHFGPLTHQIWHVLRRTLHKSNSCSPTPIGVAIIL